ncbi:MAG: TetR/AcrR family transcriptional regulator [Microscillaceae bacterium]|jgi:AcrR family transcriptional regulator|nr:TetR/AcrR family transcriptional regulator [Microscillaceae bacterium]
MEIEEHISTEERIIKAAEKIFLREGYAGARMQEIANEAKINKAMLHYYFGSKKELMEKIFSAKFKEFIPKVTEALQSETTFENVLRVYIDTYIDMLMRNPYLPLFLIDTMHRNPEFLSFTQNFPGKLFAAWLQKQVDLKKIRPIKPHHLLLNMIGLCVFPILAKPMFQKVFQIEETDYQQILTERKEMVYDFVMRAIKIDDE